MVFVMDMQSVSSEAETYLLRTGQPIPNPANRVPFYFLILILSFIYA